MSDWRTREGSNIAGNSVNLPSNPNSSKLEFCCTEGVNNTSISLISPDIFDDDFTSP
ncbi:hypothetical protein [Nostoc sphaeroides]|uniref:Uncharacterized protein n=1 Tax=Nostoc sphaeroides CCNUC1 TaxID=2653204 RepID=A0A5P8WG45_9NOSO|nr:hypothetical protein GXM_08986 [Nostoc sphaeroides CCNUC1]